MIGERAPPAHRDPTIFRPGFAHAAWRDRAERRVRRARSHSEPIRHQQEAYGGGLPIWVLTEVLDVADVSMLVEGMTVSDQWRVAEGMGIRLDPPLLSGSARRKAPKEHPLVRWLEQLSVVRNTCAHHGRVWTPAATNALRTVPGLEALPEGQSERIHGTLAVMTRLVENASPGFSRPDKVRALVEESFVPSRAATSRRWASLVRGHPDTRRGGSARPPPLHFETRMRQDRPHITDPADRMS